MFFIILFLLILAKYKISNFNIKKDCMKNLLLALFVFVICAYSAFSQVKVTTTTNHVFYGIILENTQDTLKIIAEKRSILIFPKKNIDIIEETNCYVSEKGTDQYFGKITSYSEKGIILECVDGSIRQFDYNNASISFSNSTYPFLGFTLISPGGFNLLAGAYLDPIFGVSIEGGMLPDKMYGAQLNLLINISRKKTLDQNFGLCFGYSYFDNFSFNENNSYKDWEYGGIFYDINYRGVYLQCGISFGSGSFESPQALLQLGYVYRFND